MYIIKKEYEFNIGHALSNYEGKCAKLHGHNFQVTFYYQGLELDNAEMLKDFNDFKVLKEWIDNKWDHKMLLRHDHPALNPYKIEEGGYDNEWLEKLGIVPVDFNPTSEGMAKFILGISVMLLGVPSWSLKVEVSETCTSSAIYQEG